MDIQPPFQACLSGVVQRVCRLSRVPERADLRAQRGVTHIVQNHAARHDGVETVRVLREDRRAVLRQRVAQQVFHQPARHIVARRGDIVVAAAEAGIDLEEFIAAVARVKADIEVGKARVADVLQQTARVFHHLPVAVLQDGDGVADAHRRVILQQHMAARLKAHLPALIAVAREDAHTRIVAGNEVLQEKFPWIGARAQPPQKIAQLHLVLQAVNLPFPRKLRVVVLRRGGGLGDDGIRKRQLRQLDSRAVADDRLRVRDAQFRAQAVKRILAHEPLHLLQRNVRDDEALLQRGAVLRDQADVPVAAGEQDTPPAGISRRDAAQALREQRRVLQIGDHDVFQNPGARDHLAVQPAHRDRADAVRLVKCARQTVGRDISAQNDRDKFVG